MQLPHPIRTLGHTLLGRVRVRIRGGVNEGRLWSLVALGRGYGSGTFGRDRLDALAAVTRPGDVFWDVGAHKGFVTLAASGWVGPSGRVFALEPARVNLRFLRSHLAWNGVGNAHVLPMALSDARGEAAFGGTGSSIAFRMGVGPESVEVTTGELLVEAGSAPAPQVLKIDVEGAEAAVLRGLGPHLGGDQALLVSTHGRALYEECRSLLVARGFRVYDSRPIAERLRTGAPWSSDHDLLAVGPDRTVSEDRLRSLALLAPPD